MTPERIRSISNASRSIQRINDDVASLRMGNVGGCRCMCDSFGCSLVVDISADEYDQIINATGPEFVIIVNGCAHGPSTGDVLVEERQTYRIYREQTD